MQMYNLVKSEFLKLKHNPIFLYVSCLMAISLIGHIINSMYYINIAINSGWDSFEGITCFITNIYPSNLLLLLIVILVTMFISYDFEHRITQEQISFGCSKLNMLLSKVFVIFITVVIITILYTFIYTISISAYNTFGTDFNFTIFKRMIATYLFSLLIHASLLSYIIIFSYLFKKSGLAVAANAFSVFLILMGLDKLSINIPLLNKFMTFTLFKHDLTLNLTQNEIIISIFICLAFIIFNLYVSYYIFKHSELK